MTERTILNLCAGTGAWTRPYEKAGYEVICVTLPELDVRTWQPPEQVYGVVASPPCTEFSLAKTTAPRDFVAGLEVVDACLRIIRACQLRSERLKFWCLENPRGFLRQFIGKPALAMAYWWYGDCLCKPSDLWGYFREPRRTVSEKPPGLTLMTDLSNWDQTAAQTRAITPPGFAREFFKANR